MDYVDEDDINKSTPLDNYAVIPNAVIQNKEISGLARGVLCYLLSLPKRWEIQVDHIRSEFGIGRDLMRKVFKELERHGHMRLVTLRVRDSSTLVGKRWRVYADPAQNPSFPRPPEKATVDNSGGVHKVNIRDKVNNNASLKEANAPIPSQATEPRDLVKPKGKKWKLKPFPKYTEPSLEWLDTFLDTYPNDFHDAESLLARFQGANRVKHWGNIDHPESFLLAKITHMDDCRESNPL